MGRLQSSGSGELPSYPCPRPAWEGATEWAGTGGVYLVLRGGTTPTSGAGARDRRPGLPWEEESFFVCFIEV